MDKEKTRELLSESSTFLLTVGGGICVILLFFIPRILELLYPSFTSSPFQHEFILLSRMLLVQPILLGLSSIFASVTQVHRRFVLFAISPVLYNLGIILGAVVFYPRFGLPGIGIGVLLGAVAYLAVHIPILVGAGVMPCFSIPRVATLMPIIHNSVPRSLALGISSVTARILTALASRIGTGSISVFSFASNLQAVPLSLIGASYAVAAFPALSEASASENQGEFTRILSSGARHIILWSVVSLGLIIVLRAHLVRVILGSGAFDWNATRLTAALLAILAVGIVAQGLVLLFSRALYAVRQSWRPLAYQVAGGLITVLLSVYLLSFGASSAFTLWLAQVLRVGDIAGTSVLILALTGTVGQIAIMIMALIALRKVASGLSTMLLRPLFDGTLSAIAGGVSAYAVLAVEGGIAPLTTLASVFTEALVAGIVGLVASGLVLFLLGNEEFQIAIGAFRKLISRQGTAQVLVPSAEENPQP
jgi:putative peptidoglycan lipid II flippase